MTKRKHPSQKAGQPKPPRPNAPKSVKNSRTSPETIKRAKRMRTALEFREQGYSYHQIAEEMSEPMNTVYDLVRDALAEIKREAAEHVLELELKRVDTLQSGVFSDAAAGDDQKIRTFVLLADRRDKLLGITQKQTIEVSGPNGGPVETKDVTDTQRAKALAVLIAKVKAQQKRN